MKKTLITLLLVTQMCSASLLPSISFSSWGNWVSSTFHFVDNITHNFLENMRERQKIAVLSQVEWIVLQRSGTTSAGTQWNQYEFPAVRGALPKDPATTMHFSLWFRPSDPTTAPTNDVTSIYTSTCAQLQTKKGGIKSACDYVGSGELMGYRLRIFEPNQGSTTVPRNYVRPVLITQGFDPSYGTDEQFNFEQFEGALVNSDNQEKTIDKLLDDGHTVVLLLFEKPLDGIEKNAKVALRAMQWLQYNTSDDIAIVGPSMGGLVCRKALQIAGEQNRLANSTAKSGIYPKVFVAYDAPNWGAVIPVEIQASVQYLRKQGDDVRQMDDNISSEAAQQMLLVFRNSRTGGVAKQEVKGYFTDATTGAEMQTTSAKFLRELNSPVAQENLNWLSRKSTGNTPMETVAISEGSGNDPQSKTFEDIQWAWINNWDLYWRASTPNSWGFASILKINSADAYEWEYKLKEPVFIDRLPGSNRTTYTDIWTKVKEKDKPEASEQMFTGGFDAHTFIPTVSALGLTGRDLNTRTGWYLSDNIKGSRSEASLFDRTYLFGDGNGKHVDPNSSTMSWLLAEVH